MSKGAPVVALLIASSLSTLCAQVPPSWTKRIPPAHIVGPVYYVGSEELSSFLIASKAGHILIDSGHSHYADAIAENITALRFRIKDVKILLTTQAHFDHVGAHARLKALSGARVLAAPGDAEVMEGGGKGDFFLGSAYYFPPVKVDGHIRDGQVVTLGDIALTAHLTPGHTKGATTWTMTVRDAEGQERALAVVASTTVLPGVKLVNNDTYPEIAADYQRTFKVLEALPCEVFLSAHASAFGGLNKPSFVDPLRCRSSVAASKQEFESEWAAQRRSSQTRP